MGREVIANRGIWTAKKRYILNVHDNEGVRYTNPHLKIMGIETIKSSTPAICRQALKDMFKRAGVEGIELDDAIDKFFPIYYERLEQRYKAATDRKMFDEVGNLLNELSKENNIYLGLVTGNMKRSAMIKLSPFDLERFFPVGAYASDDPERNKLPPIAVGRAERNWNVEFQNESVFVVGDTIHDIRCALVNNYRAIGVARRDGEKEKNILKSAGADWVFDRLPSSSEFKTIANLN